MKDKIIKFLRWSEKYTQTDMVYLMGGSSWLMAKQVAMVAIAFVVAIGFANLIPAETYGTYKYVMSLGAILAIPTLAGMNTSLVRSVARGQEGSFLPIFYTRLWWGFLGTLASVGVASYYFIQGNPMLAWAFVITGFFVPWQNAFTVYKSLWQGRRKFGVLARAVVLQEVLASAPVVAALFLTDDILVIIATYSIAWTVTSGLFFLHAIRTIRSGTNDPDAIPYGKHLSVMGIFGTIANQIGNIVVWTQLGAVPMAVYAFAVRPPQELKRLFTESFPIAFPKFSVSTKSEIKRTLLKKVAKLYLVLVPIIVIYIIGAPYLYRIFFPQYVDAIFYSQLFSVTILFIPMTLFGIVFQAQAQTKTLYLLSVISPIITLAGLLIFIPIYGLLGAFIAPIVMQAIGLGITLFFFLKM